MSSGPFLRKNLKFACRALLLLAAAGVLNACKSGSGGGSGSPPPEEPPADPIIHLSATASSPGSIRLSWSAPGWDIKYSVFKDGFRLTGVWQLGRPKRHTVTAGQLMPETEYCFRVVARGYFDNFYIGESTKVCAVTLVDTLAPTIPTYLEMTSDPAPQISLTWEASTDDGQIAGYKIYRDGIYLEDVSASSFTDTNVNPNTLYCYQTTAYDTAGNESGKTIKACASTTWSSSIENVGYRLGSVGDRGKTSLALDSAGVAHISYYEGINKYLKYATNTAGAWSISTIDTDVEGSSALAIDASDRMHISYCGDGVYSLRYATNASGTWVASTVDVNWVGQHSSLAVDSSGKVHISYYDHQNGNLKYATNASGTWVASTIDTGYLAQYTSLALDSADKVHISYYDVQNGDLKYITNASGTWVSSVTDNTDDVGRQTSLAVDSTDKVHISYFDTTNRHLRYATNAIGAWVTHIVDTDVTGSSTSLALDSIGNVHISYDRHSDGLRYATNSSGAWNVYLIGGRPNGASSIKLDASNRAHISSHQSGDIVYSIYSVY